MIRLWWRSLARSLRSGRTLFLLAVLGVALGVASVVAIQTLNQGALGAFDGSVRAVSGRADLTVLGLTPAFPETLLVPTLADPAVEAAWGLCRVDAAVDGVEGLLLDMVGVDLLAPVGLPLEATLGAADPGDAQAGILAAMVTPGWVAVTPELAANQGWAVGDAIEVSSGSRTAPLVIGALVDFRTLDPMAPPNLAVMDIAQVQGLLARPGLLHQIDIRLRPGTDTEAAAARLGVALGPGVTVVTPEQRQQDTRSLLAAFRLNLTALSLISVFVGVFLVLSSVQASLTIRRREFGILRCIGATPLQVRALILAEVGVLGLAGIMVGIPLGYAMALANLQTVSGTLTNIYVLDGISNLTLTPGVVLLGAAVGLCGALAGALWPAVEISRRDPLVLLAPVNLHEQVSRIAFRLSAVAALAAIAATAWFAWAGSRTNYGGFIYGGIMMLALPLVVPLVISLTAGSARPRGIGPALCLRNLAVRRQASTLAVSALAVTVSMLVGVTLLVAGFRSTLISWLDVTVRADIYVSSKSWARAGPEATLDSDLLAGLRSWPGVAAVEEQRRMHLYTADRRFRIWLNGIKVADIPGAELATRLPLKKGAPEAVAAGLEHGEILIGEPLAQKARLDIGDTLVLSGPSGPLRYRVAGIAYDYTSEGGTAFVTMPTLQKSFPGEPTSNAALFLEPGADQDDLLRDLRAAYSDRPLVLRSNADLRREVLAIFDQTFAVTGTLRTLALIIACLGVALNLLVQARERAGELGLLRSLGATRRQIFGLFVGEGLGVGILGLGLGLVGGIGLAALLIVFVNRQWFGWTIRPAWAGQDLAQQAVIILLAVVLAAVVPAWKAGQADPLTLTRDDL